MFSAQADWSRYARDYDFMGQYNPAYQQLIEEFLGIIAHWESPTVNCWWIWGPEPETFRRSLPNIFPRVA